MDLLLSRWGAIHFVAPQERQPYYNSTITEEERHFEMHPIDG